MHAERSGGGVHSLRVVGGGLVWPKRATRATRAHEGGGPKLVKGAKRGRCF